MPVTFSVPILRNMGVWKDYRSVYAGGFTWKSQRPLNVVNKIFIHHSVTYPKHNADKDVSLIASIHRKKGWGIAYNFIITSEEHNGYAICAYTGDLGTRRSHTAASKGASGVPPRWGNYYGIGICFIGMLHQVLPTEAQLKTCHELVKELLFSDYENKRFPKLTGWDCVLPHKAVESTACPGRWEEYKNKIFGDQTVTPVEEKIIYICYKGDVRVSANQDKEVVLNNLKRGIIDKVLVNEKDITSDLLILIDSQNQVSEPQTNTTIILNTDKIKTVIEDIDKVGEGLKNLGEDFSELKSRVDSLFETLNTNCSNTLTNIVKDISKTA